MKIQNLFVGMLLALLWSCGRQQGEELPPGLVLELSADSSSVLINSIPRFVMEQLKSDSLSSEDWHRLLAVYEEGNELRPVAGRYSTDSLSIVFTPEGGFKKGKTYMAECYIRNQPYNPRQMAAGRSGLFNREVYRESFDF
ncbi:MAG TPA: hypothetical protein VGE15_06660 [Sphingobacteriaceae bacterium]